MIKLFGAFVAIKKWPANGFGDPLVCVITPNSRHAFAQKDHTGRVVWYEKTWSDAYQYLA